MNNRALRTTTQAPATTATTKAATATTVAGQAADGKALFAEHCASCHKNGSGGMPGFAAKLSAAQLAAIATYLTTSN